MNSILILGFLIGMRHALEADHLAAVASMASGQTSLRWAAFRGAVWGMGHTLTLLLVGGACLVLRAAVPPRLAHLAEAAVGVMLLVLGAQVFWRMRRQRVHLHVHRHHDGTVHLHAHSHAPDVAHPEEGDHAPAATLAQQPLLAPLPTSVVADAPAAPPAHVHVHAHAHAHGEPHRPHSAVPHVHAHPAGFPRRALLVGTVHGLAGSGALLLLTLQTVGSVWLGIGYILVFGAGSILGMAALSTVMSVPLRASARFLTGAYGLLEVVIGATTMALGAWILYQNLWGAGTAG